MTVKFVGLMTGAMLLASVGVANAKGPLMTDAQLDAVTAGSMNSFEFQKQIESQSNNQVQFQAQVDIQDQFQKQALILVASQVLGNSASLGFDNEAAGPNSNVQGTLSQLAAAGLGSSQTGLFVAAANK